METKDLMGLLKDEEKVSIEKDNALPSGISLKQSEWAAIDDIALDTGMTRHKVTTYAVRYFLQKYKSGEVDKQTRVVVVLPEI